MVMEFQDVTEVTTTDPSKVVCPLPIVPRPISFLDSDYSAFSDSDSDGFADVCDNVRYTLGQLGIESSRADLLETPPAPEVAPSGLHTPDTTRNSATEDEKKGANLDAQLQSIVKLEVAWSKIFSSAGTNMPVDVDALLIPLLPQDHLPPERFHRLVVDVDRILNYQKLYEDVHLESTSSYTINGQPWGRQSHQHDLESFMWALECDGITWVHPQDRFVVVPATTQKHIDIAIANQCWTLGLSTNNLLNYIYQQSAANGTRTWMFVSNPTDATIRGIGEMVSPIDPRACMAEFGSALVGSGRVKWHLTATVGGLWLDGLTTQQGTSLTMSGPPAELDWLTAREVIDLFLPE